MPEAAPGHILSVPLGAEPAGHAGAGASLQKSRTHLTIRRSGLSVDGSMKRLAAIVFAAYLGVAVLARVRERSGRLTCGCSSSCWCKRPGLSLFRWVLPVGHRGV